MISARLTHVSIVAALMFIAIAAPARATAQVQTQSKADSIARAKAMQVEMAKFDDPMPHMAKSRPAGTAWDSQYRSFIQTDSAAKSKGMPSHAIASTQIQLDAGQSAEKRAMHKGWVLYIKHFSQAYRPESATADLKKLYTELVKLEFAK